MIQGLNSGLLLAYENFSSKTKVTPQEIFIRLSLSIGGDGQKITKAELDTYIQKAESNPKISKKKLDLLKKLQKNWDTISNKQDSITASDLEKAMALAISILTSEDGIETDDDKDKDKKVDDKKDTKKSLKEEAFDELAKKVGADDKGITKDQLQSHLKTLIADTAESADHSNEIGFVTNLIADFNTLSGGNDYIKSFNETQDYTNSPDSSLKSLSSPINIQV